eukprot:2255666-Rhodomonas_salina.1
MSSSAHSLVPPCATSVPAYAVPLSVPPYAMSAVAGLEGSSAELSQHHRDVRLIVIPRNHALPHAPPHPNRVSLGDSRRNLNEKRKERRKHDRRGQAQEETPDLGQLDELAALEEVVWALADQFAPHV